MLSLSPLPAERLPSSTLYIMKVALPLYFVVPIVDGLLDLEDSNVGTILCCDLCCYALDDSSKALSLSHVTVTSMYPACAASQTVPCQ